MSGEKRRENLLKILQESHKPVSGTKLAEKFQVSRQVVVQDIALLRASNHDIVSTHKGYVLKDKDHISIQYPGFDSSHDAYTNNP